MPVLGDSAFFYGGVGEQLTFAEAEDACAAMNMTLATPASNQENALFHALDPNVSHTRWIGVQRDRTGSSVSPFSWTSVEDNAPFTVDPSRWQPSQPSDTNGVEDCVVMGRVGGGVSPGTWDDVACTATASYVCRALLVDLQATCPSTTPLPTTTEQPQTTAQPEATTTTEPPCGNWNLTFSSTGAGGLMFTTVFDGDVSTAVTSTNKRDTTREAFTAQCQCLAAASDDDVAGVWVWTASRQYFCYHLLDTGANAGMAAGGLISESYARV
jgi:hypothetical protein